MWKEEAKVPNYGAVFKVKEGINGLTKSDLMDFLTVIDPNDQSEFESVETLYPIEIQGTTTESSLMGYIKANTAHVLGYEYLEGSDFYQYLSDMVDKIINDDAPCEDVVCNIEGNEILVHIAR
jgi:hypothetical protein